MTPFADHANDRSQDAINRLLHDGKLKPHSVWDEIRDPILATPADCVIPSAA